MRQWEVVQQEVFNVVTIDNSISHRLRVRPMYFELGLSEESVIYTRECVLQRLVLALGYLPDNIGFEVWDVYRSRAVQGKLFEWMRGEVRKLHPHFTEEEVFVETKKYASLPAKVGEVYCSPHLSGGAVDLTLFNVESGQVLEMGTPFDDCSPRAHALYFEEQKSDESIRQSRALLRNAMLQAGFTLYQYEWWHFDYGNLFWSQTTGKPALFGPLFGDDEWPA
jgi:D-alanyl-D-alanine dipeptidase